MPPVQGTDGSGSGITLSTTFGVWGDSTTGNGVAGTSNSGDGVHGQSGKAVGVRGMGGRSAMPVVSGVVGVLGDSKNGPGVFGASEDAEGVRGESLKASGVSGRTNATTQAGVIGMHAAPAGFGVGTIGGTLSPDPLAVGVGGVAPAGTGVLGISARANGVRGISERTASHTPPGPAGVWGSAQNGLGVYGSSNGADGVHGVSGPAPGNDGFQDERVGGDGVHGETSWGAHAGVYALNKGPGGFCNGVYSYSDNGNGMFTRGRNGIIAWGHPWRDNNVAVEGLVFGSKSMAVYAYSDAGTKTARAGYFWGSVDINGHLWKSGGGFRIDHPLEPAKRYLNHSFVESSERKNIYDGIAVLDRRGEAVVRLPKWLETVNRDFRYQLTAVGGPAPDLHIAREISKGRFRIGGGRRGLRVSWQVTGVRKDVWAEANPLEVEERKTGFERGSYLHPVLHGKPATKSIEHARSPERMKRIEQARRSAAQGSSSRQARPARRGREKGASRQIQG